MASGSDDEVEDEGQVGYRINHKKQRQRVRAGRAGQGQRAYGMRGRMAGCASNCSVHIDGLLNTCCGCIALQEYEAWKQKVTAKTSSAAGGTGAADAAAEAGPSGSGVGGSNKEQLAERKLRQAVLSFAAPPAAPAVEAAAAEGGSAQAIGQPAAAAAEATPAAEPHGKAVGSKGKTSTKKAPAKKAPPKKAPQKATGGKGRTPQREALASKNN